MRKTIFIASMFVGMTALAQETEKKEPTEKKDIHTVPISTIEIMRSKGKLPDSTRIWIDTANEKRTIKEFLFYGNDAFYFEDNVLKGKANRNNV